MKNSLLFSSLLAALFSLASFSVARAEICDQPTVSYTHSSNQGVGICPIACLCWGFATITYHHYQANCNPGTGADCPYCCYDRFPNMITVECQGDCHPCPPGPFQVDPAGGGALCAVCSDDPCYP